MVVLRLRVLCRPCHQLVRIGPGRALFTGWTAIQQVPRGGSGGMHSRGPDAPRMHPCWPAQYGDAVPKRLGRALPLPLPWAGMVESVTRSPPRGTVAGR